MKDRAKDIQPSQLVVPTEKHLSSVLFVDDDPVDRHRIITFCKKTGLNFKAEEAGDLAQMAAALDRYQFDLVFLDYHLGVETGLEALALVKAHGRQKDAIPIMVTSVGEHDIIVEAMRSGCADYLIKDELSAESIRKSVTMAIERNLLLAVISSEHSTRAALAETVDRFSRASAPDMRAIMAAMMRRVRSLRGDAATNPNVARNLQGLEDDCANLFGYLDEVNGLVAVARDAVDGKGVPRPPRLE